MIYERIKRSTSTHAAADNLINLINKPECVGAYFVRTLSVDDGSAGEDDFTSTNFPLVVGFLRISLSKALEDIVIVFDGLHMTGVRTPRAMELKSVLAAAANNNKAFISDGQVKFTSSLSAKDAYGIFSSLEYRSITAKSFDEDLHLLSSGYASLI